MILIGALAAALVAASAPTVSAPSVPTDAAGAKPYVSGFCVPFALGGGDPERLRRLFTVWTAKAASDDKAEVWRPQDAEIAGQMVEFADPAAPHAFVDRRRGTCSLVFSGVRTPDAVTDDFAAAALPIGGYTGTEVERWRRVTTKRVGPPGPIRYFIASTDVVGAGLCATAFEDLRLRDNSPVVLVRVSLCRLGPDDTLE